MREEPSLAELVAAVAGFLREKVMPNVDGGLQFHARVAANVLDICAREITTGTGAEARELGRLRKLLQADGSAADLNAQLCAAIRDGRIAGDDPALVGHLWATTLDTVAIDQPRYATYRRALQFAGATEKGEN